MVSLDHVLCPQPNSSSSQLYALSRPLLSALTSPTHPLCHRRPQLLFRLQLSLRHHQLPRPVTFSSLTPSLSPLSMSFKRTRLPSPLSLSTLRALCLQQLPTRGPWSGYSACQTPRSCGSSEGALPAQGSLV